MLKKENYGEANVVKQRFTIRKLTVGVVSMLIGLTFFISNTSFMQFA